MLNGQDTLALLPTGGGKSLCFQVPAMLLPGTCIVISPLIALIQDQVEQLAQKHISAAAIYTGMTYAEIERILHNCIYGNTKFLYLSPERIQHSYIQQCIEQMQVNLIVVDEAHCISQWGHDFRPSYRQIAHIRILVPPKTPLIALTATATPKVTKDIQKQLLFKRKHVIQGSFERKNLAYIVRKEEKKLDKAIDILSKIEGTSILYVRSRVKTKDIAQYLSHFSLSADFYHAGLSTKERKQKQKKWMQGHIRVMVCTNAFGMGIDKPDVRTVIHLDLPDSIEAYFQEAGRAGRDRQKAYAILLFNDSDILRLSKYIDIYPNIKEVKSIYNALANYCQIAIGSGKNKSYDFEIRDFCHRMKQKPLKTIYALNILKQQSLIDLSENIYSPSKLKVIARKHDLYRLRLENKSADILIKSILRTYEGLFDSYVPISEKKIAQSIHAQVPHVHQSLLLLHRIKIISYIPSTDSPQIIFLQARLDIQDILLDSNYIKERKAHYKNQIERVIQYVQKSSKKCTSQFLLSYFGEKNSSLCKQCDFCLHKKRIPSPSTFASIEKSVYELLQNQSTCTDTIIRQLDFDENQILLVLKEMIKNETIKFVDGVLKKSD